jgi:hypothetical protein
MTGLCEILCRTAVPIPICSFVHARTKVTGSLSWSTVRSYQCSSPIFSPGSAPICAIAKPSASFPLLLIANSTISASPVSRSKTLCVSTSPRKRELHCTPCPRPPSGGRLHFAHRPRRTGEALILQSSKAIGRLHAADGHASIDRFHIRTASQGCFSWCSQTSARPPTSQQRHSPSREHS